MSDRKRHKTRHPGVYFREKPDGGRTYMIWFVGTDGRPRFENVPGGEKEAVKARARVTDRIAHGHKVAPTREKMDTYSRRWLETYFPTKARTKENCTWAVEKHIVRLLGSQKVTSMDVHKVAWYISELKKAGYKGWTIKATLTPLRHILKAAVRDGLLPNNPVDLLERHERPKNDALQPEILDSKEIKVFLDSATDWYRPLLATAIFTGMRISELLNLKWEDVDWDRGLLYVKTSKTRAGERKITLMPALQQVLAGHSLEHAGSTFVFETHEGQQMKARTVRRWAMEETLKRSGIQKHLRFHDLRHTHASILIDQGHPDSFICEQMGHTSIDTTYRIYGHLMDKEDKMEAMRKSMDAAFGEVLGASPGQAEPIIQQPSGNTLPPGNGIDSTPC